jgi:hypothetical protein
MTVRLPDKLAVVTVVHFDAAVPNASHGILQNGVDRLPYLRATAAHLAQLAEEVTVTVVTNTVDPDQLATLRGCLQDRGFQFQVQSEVGLAHGWMLPTRVSPVLRTLAGDPSTSHFMYFDYDILITRENISYWLEAREVLRRYGLIPSFLRVERRVGDARWYVTDTPRPLQISTLPRVEPSETSHFVGLPTPFQGGYLLDRELVTEYLSGLPHVWGQGRHWGGPEGELEGLTFANVPDGFHARNVVPYLPVERRVDPRCLVHHLPNNYASGAGPYGQVLLEELLIHG